MPSSDWKETALIAAFAAGFGSMMALQLMSQKAPTTTRTSKDSDNEDYYERRKKGYAGYYHRAPDEPTFLENGRTRVANDDDDMAESVVKGWSMAEALVAARKESATVASMSPREVLQSLQRGNMRFYSGHASRPEKSAFHRRVLISQQFPSTAVLGCSDSRVPVEIVFDQGLGDMFVVRVAGNCLGTTTEASLQYSVHHLNVKVLMVMGHEGCGAIKAAGLPKEKINQEPVALASLLNNLKSALENSTDYLPKIIDARARDREAVASNVANQVVKLAEDPQILAKIEAGKLKIVGAFYEISSGIVDFFHLVSQEVPGTEFKPSPGVQSRYNPRTKEIVYA